MSEVTHEILQAITDKGTHVLHVKPHLTGGVEQYFFYRSNSGPQYGWWLFREEEDGDETPLCDVSTRRQLCLAVELFDICSPELLFPKQSSQADVDQSADESQLEEIDRLNALIASSAEAMDLVFEVEQGSKFDQQEVDAKLDKAYRIIQGMFPDERHDFESVHGVLCKFCGGNEKHPNHYQIVNGNRH